MVKWLLNLLVIFAQSSKIVEYKFYKNYGQVFYDYSGNFNHAVNGQDINTTSLDVTSCDRGIFFNDNTQKITLPPNNVSLSSIKFSKTFTILFWVLTTIDCSSLSSSIYFFRKIVSGGSSRLNFFLNRNPCQIKVFSFNYPTTFTTSSQGTTSLTKNNWDLVWLQVQGATAAAGVSAKSKSIITLSQDYDEGESTFDMELGALYPLLSTKNDVKYFFWNFIIFDSYENVDSLLSTDSVNCYSETCNSGCEPGILIDGYDYCLPINSFIDRSGNGKMCNCTNFGCTNEIECLDDLDCEFPSIEFIGNKRYCKCFPECDSCVTYLKCKSCLDPYAKPSDTSGCICKDGYYNLTELGSSNDSCKICHEDCLTCEKADTCLTCKLANSKPSNIGCECIEKTFLYIGEDGEICKDCLFDCKTCTNETECLTCVYSGAIPHDQGCICPSRSYNDSSSLSCKKCQSDCESCETSQTCITCLDPNSTPSPSSEGCECLEGYYKSSSLCEKCHQDCKSCSSYPTCLSCIDANSSPSPTGAAGCTCNKNFYFESSSSTCEPCASNCSACSSISSCKSCFDQSSCICSSSSGSGSGSGLYPNSNQTCDCSVTCKTCQEPVCETCHKGFYLSDSQCLPCDKSCKTCQGPEDSDCTSCGAGLPKLVQGKCECGLGTYLKVEGNDMSCEPCGDLCGTCFGPSDLECLTCRYEDMVLDGSSCRCFEGFYLDQGSCLSCGNVLDVSEFNCTCTYNDCGLCEIECLACLNSSNVSYLDCKSLGDGSFSTCMCLYPKEKLYVKISISFDNLVTILFTKPLETNLTKSDFQVTDKNALNNLSFELIFVSNVEYKLYLVESVLGGGIEKVVISFKGNIYSVFGDQLENSVIEIHLFRNEKGENIKVKRNKNIARNGIFVGAVGSLVVSVITNDYSCLFNFLNFAEVYASISLFDISIQDELTSFLANLRIQRSFSNIFKSIQNDDSKKYLNKVFTRYGFESRSIIINSGPVFTTLFIMIIVYTLYKRLPYFLFNNYSLMALIRTQLEYNFFIRFWIQIFFEISLTSLYGISFAGLHSGFFIFDFFISYIAIVIKIQIIQVTLITFFLHVIYKKHFLLDREEAKKYQEKFSSFFEEFNQSSFENSWFYFVFFVRRMTIAICVTIIRIPSLSFVLSFVMSITVTNT